MRRWIAYLYVVIVLIYIAMDLSKGGLDTDITRFCVTAPLLASVVGAISYWLYRLLVRIYKSIAGHTSYNKHYTDC